MARETYLDYNRPAVGEDEAAAVAEAVRSLWITRGPRVGAFEQALSAYLGGARVVALNSCTAALHLALIAGGVGPGDEVITTPLTFAASVNVILHVGATPVLADVDPATGCLDPEAARAAVTPATRAILPVDLAGHPADWDALEALAAERGLTLVEDAAHAIAAEYHGRRIGSFPWLAAFSFYATKNLTTGEGGALVVPDPATEDRVRVLGLHGMSKNAWTRYTKAGQWRYDILEPGYKYNMTDVQAALGLVQLGRLPALQVRRTAIAERMNQAFATDPALTIPCVAPGVVPAWHLYPLRLVPGALSIGRDAFIEKLTALNIGTAVHFIPISHMTYYRERFGWRPGMFSRADAYFESEISLPLYPSMTDGDVDDVIETVLAVSRAHRA